MEHRQTDKSSKINPNIYKMNKKVIIGAVVVVGAILAYKHFKKQADLKKQVKMASETSNASGQATTRKCSAGGASAPNAGTIATCSKVCEQLGGDWDAGNITCTANFGMNVPSVFGGRGGVNRQVR